MYQKTTFLVPPDFGKGKKVVLDLGAVAEMVQVTLNGKEFNRLRIR